MEILLAVWILSLLSSSVCDSAPRYQILYELDDQRQSFDVMSIFQMAATVANLLPFSDMVTSHVSEVTKLFAYQMWTKYLNPWL